MKPLQSWDASFAMCCLSRMTWKWPAGNNKKRSKWFRCLKTILPLLPLNFPDIRPLLARAAKGGLLEGLDLRDISLVLSMSQSTNQWLERHVEACPTVSKRSAEVS